MERSRGKRTRGKERIGCMKAGKGGLAGNMPPTKNPGSAADGSFVACIFWYSERKRRKSYEKCSFIEIIYTVFI
jgi:hypothetical protein